jgi:hypothetical protein
VSAESRERFRARQRREEARRIVVGWHQQRNARRVYRPRERGYTLLVAPARVGVRSYLHDRQGKAAHELPRRGVCRGWNARVRERFRRAIAAIHWPATRYLFQTLTYPGGFPRDPELWKLQLRAYAQAWRRRWGPLFAVWVLEFQRRGAPHFHIVAVAPEGVADDEMRRWSAATWHRIVTGCSGDHEHARGLGAGCEPWHYERAMAEESLKHADDARGAVQYLTNELGKESQKSLPAWLDDDGGGGRIRGAGRWWGLWGFELSEQLIPLRDRREFLAARRRLRSLGERYLARRRAELRAYRRRKLARGEVWKPPPRPPDARPPGAWLRPPDGMGLTVRDPELRADTLARSMLAALASMRGAVRGSFAALEHACPQPRMGWA